jgi:prepilin-type N-terminal cleavage/methylation domain-containing protein
MRDGTRPPIARPGIVTRRSSRSLGARPAGFTLLEVMLSVAVLSVLVGVAVPISTDAIDESRTAGAARYLAARIMAARMDAIKRATAIGLRFQPALPDYTFRAYADGNGNGVRSTDIQDQLDGPLGAPERIADNFPGVRFELMSDLPDVDGVRDGRLDGIRIGTARILTMSPDGTATSGTLYLRGRRSQYAVRVLGATGRTRVLHYHTGEHTWISR